MFDEEKAIDDEFTCCPDCGSANDIENIDPDNEEEGVICGNCGWEGMQSELARG